MSFSKNTKLELCTADLPDEYAEKAFVYGMLLFSKVFSAHAISFTTECAPAANIYIQQIAALTCTIVEMSSGMKRRGGENQLCQLRIPDKNDCARLFDFFGHSASQPSLRINRANIEREEDIPYFLRGVFLVCGNVTHPEKDYHLEFVVPHMKLAHDLAKIISDSEILHFHPKVIQRKGSYIVYLKESDKISDLLTYMGAQMSALEFMQSKIMKSVRNLAMRKTNSETANIKKTADASARQIAAIELIQKKSGLNSLPEELQELAKVRLEHPEYNLRELGEATDPKISRSGANHRMMRILEYAEELK